MIKNNFSTRTLYLPNADLRTKYIEYDWEYFSFVELSQAMGRKPSVLNGVSAWPNEVDLITSALSEYKKHGYSNLIKFTGADKAVVQNDFVSPDYEGNPLSGLVDEFVKSDDFTFDKSIGRWDIYNYEKVTLPRIYSPTTISFVSSTPENLDIVANMPNALAEGFVWSDYLEDSKKERLFDKLIIQARCWDCPGTSYNIFFSTSKVMIPGTVSYELGKLVTELKKNISQAVQRQKLTLIYLPQRF